MIHRKRENNKNYRGTLPKQLSQSNHPIKSKETNSGGDNSRALRATLWAEDNLEANARYTLAAKLLNHHIGITFHDYTYMRQVPGDDKLAKWHL
ncbi:unnamed protein product [Linum trigynum]|uniref:Uncharacterized protein n=1 Tax=Linum trigynum TaxID=586398 RepID=A0AAV2GYM6_9ROSI